MFVASVQYPICQHPDDFNFCFCQGCGYNQKILRVATVGQVYVDLDAIGAQVQQLLIMTKPLATQNKRIHFKRNSRVSFPNCQAMSNLHCHSM